jgi:protein TonB
MEMPELANRSEVVQELSRAYPPELRNAGVTGTVHLRMRVLEDGSVDEPTITIVAADQGFGESAVQVVRRMRFRPARVEHRPVKVWVSIPVVFQPQPSFDPQRALPPSRRP